MDIVVAGADHAAATLVATGAVRMVRQWGLVSALAVAERARALAPSAAVAGDVDRVAPGVLEALPRTRWLDGNHEWFSFLDPESQLEIAIAKIFWIARRVGLDELRAALAKTLPATCAAPDRVLRRYLTEIAGCSIDGRFVRRASPERSCLTRREASIVKLLEAGGRDLDLKELRRRARAAALPRTTVAQLIRLSPLFLLAAHRRVRLLGDGSRAIYA